MRQATWFLLLFQAALLANSPGNADEAPGRIPSRAHYRMVVITMGWLGSRDSNPNYLIQSQASYR